ncbi:MAG: hypothetical protein LBC79_03250, partial [Deltaproteobacteria bacterium]|nr:hypothetical protein [Deltaproteobacteria bacterium]
MLSGVVFPASPRGTAQAASGKSSLLTLPFSHGTLCAFEKAKPKGVPMKNEILHLAATMLSPEEQDLLERLGEL